MVADCIGVFYMDLNVHKSINMEPVQNESINYSIAYYCPESVSLKPILGPQGPYL